MQKPIRVSRHAKRRMYRYGLSEDVVTSVLREPDHVLAGYRGRKIAHKFKNEYVLRVIYEEDDVLTVITVYPARHERYAEKV